MGKRLKYTKPEVKVTEFKSADRIAGTASEVYLSPNQLTIGCIPVLKITASDQTGYGVKS